MCNNKTKQKKRNYDSQGGLCQETSHDILYNSVMKATDYILKKTRNRICRFKG